MIDAGALFSTMFGTIFQFWWVFALMLFVAYLQGKVKKAQRKAKSTTSSYRKSTPQNDACISEALQKTTYREKKQKGDAYEAFVAEYFREQGFTVAEHGQMNGRNDKGIDLILKKDMEITLVQCKNWSENTRYKINHEKVKAFVGDTAFYLEDNPMYANYTLKRLYVVANRVLDRSAINYIKANSGKIRYLHLPMA